RQDARLLSGSVGSEIRKRDSLMIVQKARGWMPNAAADAIGAILGIPASDVKGVATFYSQIFRQPVGRHIIRVCDSMTCFVVGHENVLVSIKDQHGIAPGLVPYTHLTLPTTTAL
ncbi:hypothetical protein GUJ73_24990, partial|uniref:NAD(P)H-dependent oxidoreductase subunit E n=1 Tax=Escherichia coli TaxID=562 RepID=UPI0016B3F819|nr:hypothetical protein [Escherichia coli]